MQVQIAPQERNWAMAAHLTALVAIAGLPFGHVLGPLVVYLIKGHESEFVAEHARASLNYQITVSLFFIVAIIVAIGIVFGVFLPMSATSPTSREPGLSFFILWAACIIGLLLVLLFSVIFIIMGTAAASAGRPYTYPFAIRFLR
jgi:uncharacterized protein